jgi:hypothetical protein
MSEPKGKVWQFSLAELLFVTTVAAALAAMLKVMGSGILCVIFHPLLVLIYLAFFAERILRRRLQQQREQRALKELAAKKELVD